MAVQTAYPHVELNDKGVPIISGTTMKVIELVLDHIAYDWSPEELQYQHPYLTMGQVHSALAYYWDHKLEFDQAIAEQETRVQEYRKSMPESPLVQRIRAMRGQ